MVSPIRYYKIFNNGVGIVIWAQLMNTEGVDNILWDGRYGQGGAATMIGKSSIVDLKATGIQPGVPFYLSSHTLWGSHQADRTQKFVYDPHSNMMASAVRTGPAGHGQLNCKGTVAYGEPYIVEKNVWDL